MIGAWFRRRVASPKASMPAVDDDAPLPTSAASRGLTSCHVCGLVQRITPGHPARCPRCEARVHVRKPDSLSRTWALLLAAYVLYIPANLLPMMETRTIFGLQQDTIMSGVVLFWTSGSWMLAIIVFTASILVPLLKLFALTYLLLTVGRRSRVEPENRTRLYRVVELIGRWSMLDVFVVALVVALVQIRSLATITAGTGTTAFGAVVVLTLLASRCFDSRLIWDHARQENAHD
jgi:paraquat-inducible protein A